MQIGRLNLQWHNLRNWISIPLFSVALLIPCFWQSRIQSADLSSHIYNAWLASKIHQGTAPGLWISSQSNNVLFDLMLEWLLVKVGPSLAQRLAVSISVLVFGWGAIRFIFSVAGSNWWFAAPCVAMFSYGFIFHMGFFNFYLSIGFCLWYLAIFWDCSHNKAWKIQLMATPILIVAWIAHPFPVVWTVGTAAYIALANSIQPRRRTTLLLPGLAALATTRFILTHRYAYSWSLDQATFITGANQIALFGLKYVPPFAALLLIWTTLLHSLIKRRGIAGLLSTIPFQLWLLNAAAVLLLPGRVLFPHFERPLGFIAERLSLAAGLMLCATVAAAPTTRFVRVALLSVAVLFFSLLYVDNRELNRMEDRLDIVVNQLPPGQRVMNTLLDQSLRALCLHHDLDRACIDHCFSYANYEPSSRQFRIRAQPENKIVFANDADVDAASSGAYVVQPRDLPLYLIYPCGSDFSEICARPLQAGESSEKPK
jgi:hypothetical protein